MKVHMNIAAGYKRGELKQWFDESPDAAIDPDARIAAIRAWVGNRFCSWLDRQDIKEFDVYEVTTEYFRIDFLHDTDAQLFVSQIGGRVLEE